MWDTPTDSEEDVPDVVLSYENGGRQVGDRSSGRYSKWQSGITGYYDHDCDQVDDAD
jgi:hypothetical protein